MTYAHELDHYILVLEHELARLTQSNFPNNGRLVVSKVLHPKPANATGPGYMFTEEKDEPLEVTISGIVGSRKYAPERASNGRERFALPKGAHLKNYRHLLAVSEYDCEKLSDKMGVEITPELLGVNLVLEREDREPYELTALLPNTHLQVFDKSVLDPPEDNTGLEALLQVQTEQMGCKITGNSIANYYKDTSLAQRFEREGKRNRGLVLSLEHPVDLDDRVAEFIPGQRVYVRFPTGRTK